MSFIRDLFYIREIIVNENLIVQAEETVTK